MSNHLFAGNIKAIYDARFVGDQFMKEVFDTFGSIIRHAKRKETPTAIPYLETYYNVQGYYPNMSDIKTNATARIINAVIEALNDEDRLPRYLVIALDKDILSDFKQIDFGITKEITAVLNWLTRQVDIAVRQKRLQIESRKYGALNPANDHPTIIYIDMIRRFGRFEDKITDILSLRYKFNKLLHEAVHNQCCKVMSIQPCVSGDHFDMTGNLTNKAKIEFWHEVDNLLERVNFDKVKLNPKLHLKNDGNNQHSKKRNNQRQRSKSREQEGQRSSATTSFNSYERYFKEDFTPHFR